MSAPEEPKRALRLEENPDRPALGEATPARDAEIVTGVFDEGYDPKISSRFTRVPDGIYELGYLGCEERMLYGRPTYVSEWEILARLAEGEDRHEYRNWLLRRYAAKPAETEHFSLRGSFAKDFQMITGLVPPRHLHRIPPSAIYSNCIVEARVGLVTTDEDGDPLPETSYHSVVRKILRRVEGSPPYLSRRRRGSDE